MQPLADEVRPKSLDEFVGQEHLVGEGKPIRKLVEEKKPFSMILWGPPGVGKTTLAGIIADETGSSFVQLSAVSAGKADVKKVVEQAREGQMGMKEIERMADRNMSASQTVLFLDEIHRFNKAQQDFLLPYVEDGTIILIGATTENPSFEVISPLLSRTQVFVLEELTDDQLREILERGKAALGVRISKKAADYLIRFANGDARKVLNVLESTSKLYKKITFANVKDAIQSKLIRYDKAGDEHYNTISAFIKSMRASNVDAAMYYLARMVEAGEDPLFIARRMVIFASEDIGLAQPTALVVANGVFRACETIGYPECAINLAHGVAYLAQAKKDRSAYEALGKAKGDVQKYGNLPIPKEILNAPTDLMKKFDYGKGYEAYTDKDLLPDRLKGTKYLKGKINEE
jgi:putative ATPase